MKKKKLLCLGLSFLLLFGVTGCDKVKLNSEQNDLIAEYVAGVMLKYSYENQWDYEQVKKRPWQDKGENATQAPTNSSQNSVQTGSQNGTVPNVDASRNLLEALGIKNVSIEYDSFVIADKYPEGDYLLSVKKDSGCKLMVVKFNLKNSTSETVNINTVSNSAALKLSIGGSVIVQSATLLENDLMGIKNVSIAAGESYEAVAVFQVPEGLTSNTSNMSIAVYVSGNSIGKVLGL